VHNVEGPTKLLNVIRGPRIKILKGKLDDGWRINDTAVALPEATCSGSDGLLTDTKDIAIQPRF